MCKVTARHGINNNNIKKNKQYNSMRCTNGRKQLARKSGVKKQKVGKKTKDSK